MNSGTTTTTTTNNNNNNKKRTTTKTSSLVSLLPYMEGMEIIVELKTGKMYRGILSSIDGNNMDIILENSYDIHNHHRNHRQHTTNHHDITTTTTTTTVQVQEEIPATSTTTTCIRGPKIRYIHFPEDVVDLNGVIRTGMDRERSAKNMYKRGKRK